MTTTDESLADMIKAFEGVETKRRAAPGEAVVVRVDGAGFSKFTSRFWKPFDVRIHDAMVAASTSVLQLFNCRIAYTQSDEANFVLYEDGEGELPHGGRLQKLASRLAGLFSVRFALELSKTAPELVSESPPHFYGCAYACPPDIAARSILWRELDGRRNAISGAGRTVFPHAALMGKDSREVIRMLAAEGVRFEEMPEAFRRGTFLRRRSDYRMMSEEELLDIPVEHRPTGPVIRGRVERIEMPPLIEVANLERTIMHGDRPEVRVAVQEALG